MFFSIANKLREISRLVFARREDNSFAVDYNSLNNVNCLNERFEHWNSARKKDSIFINNVYNDIVSICDVDENKKVLDIGCGTGVLVSRLKADYNKINVKGCDFSKEKIRICREYYELDPSIFFCRSIYDEIIDKYDLIIATEVLEHLEYPDAAIKNMLNGLQASGCVFLTVPDGRLDSFKGHIHFWSPESWSLFIHEVASDVAKVEVGRLCGKNYALLSLNV